MSNKIRSRRKLCCISTPSMMESAVRRAFDKAMDSKKVWIPVAPPTWVTNLECDNEINRKAHREKYLKQYLGIKQARIVCYSDGTFLKDTLGSMTTQIDRAWDQHAFHVSQRLALGLAVNADESTPRSVEILISTRSLAQ